MKQKLIVFTRIPEGGRNKTRLIPALGPEGAAAYHDQLARHAIGRASAFTCAHPRTDLEIRVTGGNAIDGRDWLGGGSWILQGEGDLGTRLRNAVREAFESGSEKVLVLGTDCPRVDGVCLESAFKELDRNDMVIGPAADGGYYLIGFKRFDPDLFSGISWGGSEVFSQTMARALKAGLTAAVLDVLPDVDLPEDLADSNLVLSEAGRVSVVIPALNEEGMIGATLDRLKEGGVWEILVADGGSSDRTREIAVRKGARVIEGARGRAAQMNRAAAEAKGEYLFFLHADSQPPAGFRDIMIELLGRPGVVAAAFSLGVAGELGAAAMIEALVDLRCRLLGRPYGDQGLLIRRSIFVGLGGFPDVPVLEDLRMIEMLKRLGTVVVARERMMTSGRQWESRGLLRSFLRHQAMLAGHYLGFSPELISKLR